MQHDIHDFLSRMTLEEKAGMCFGLDFRHLKSVERLGIPSRRISSPPAPRA